MGLWPVGAAPTPTPVSSAVALNNPGFESGNLDGWDVTQPLGAFTPQEVSPIRVHSGSQAVRAVYLNDNGKSTTLGQSVFLIPGANYTVSGWVSHDNPASLYCNFVVYAFPYSARTFSSLSLTTVPAGTWVRHSTTFQAAASFANIFANIGCGVMGTVGSDPGKNVLYIDDISVVQTSSL